MATLFAGVSAAASLAGGVVGFLGSRTQAAAARLQAQQAVFDARASAQANKFNAIVREQQARNAKDVAKANAEDFRRLQSARLASSRAAQAGSGFQLTGSPLLVDTLTFGEIEHGVSRLRHEGDVEATRLGNEASLLRRQAKLDKVSARYAKAAGRIGVQAAHIQGYSSLLSGVSSAGSTLATAGIFG